MTDDSSSALHLLAQHTLSEKVEVAEIGEVARERVVLGLLDLVGCYVASSAMGANAEIMHVELSSVQCNLDARASLWGSSRHVGPALAALANGTIAHHAEFDGGWHGAPGVGAHPAISVLPAAVAVAECCGATGEEFIAAAAAGYDVLAALARCLSPAIARYRFHPPGFLGSFGAAAAACRLQRNGVEATRRALAACGGMTPLCPFESFTAGACAKDFYGGWPAAIGVVAASTSELTTNPFKVPQFLGRPPISAAEIAPFLQSAAAADADFKAYPVCRSVHPALTAIDQLLAENSLVFEEVESICVETYPYAVELDASSDALRPIGAKTSVLTCLAMRLRLGALKPHYFNEAVLRLPEIIKLTSRSTIDTGRYAGRTVRGATVTLQMRAGGSISCSVESEKWSANSPASSSEIISKFDEMTEEWIRKADRDELVERLMNLHRAPSLTFITEILSRRASRVGAMRMRRPRSQLTATCEELLRGRSEVVTGLTRRGGNGELLAQLSAAVDAGVAGGTEEEFIRTLTLSLALTPACAGPMPADWHAQFGRDMTALARAGFSGPSGVIAGPRGLRHIACIDEAEAPLS